MSFNRIFKDINVFKREVGGFKKNIPNEQTQRSEI